MLIPVKCFTCGKVLANKYHYYLKQVELMKKKNGENDEIQYLDTDTDIQKSVEGIILDKLNLTDVCCRRHMLTHVDIF